MRMVQSLVQLTCSYESLPTSGMLMDRNEGAKKMLYSVRLWAT